jgi:2-polyprenyl-6-methoxyphenol hydroxylase-like FAD-dependent oxidoreductase/catechol 2,3-dioxygenase-like lactoylglutathione lyase family enzyme
VTRRFDVAVVGYGPVGQMAAILLGRIGHSVGVFERWPSLYPRPRAVHYDDETARIFQHVDLAAKLSAITEPATTYEWRNAAGQTLLMLDRSEPGPSGWPAATMFTQPDLERLLDQTAKLLPSVEVHQGWEVADVIDVGDHVRLALRSGTVEGGEWTPTGEVREVTADYAIGCDGANSLVRERMKTGLEDLGFAFDWLIADTLPRDPSLLAGVNLQVCDPARPTTMVSGGPGRRRWEWMLLPGETREEVERLDFVWRLLGRSGVGEDEVTLERHAVYTFRARWAERWREGRLTLAGDAAHLMPPFAGQGMCSGIRDAFTLAWHLDLVLRGRAAGASLDAYTSERLGHLQHAISLSVELGKVMCISDEAEARARDETLLALAADPSTPPIEPPAPVLGPGVREAPGRASGEPAAAGSLFPQALVSIDARTVLLEDACHGNGFVLYLLGAEPRGALDEHAREYLDTLAAPTVVISHQMDLVGVYRAWFERHGCVAALVRPDFYVFGTAATGAEVRAMIDRLRTALNDEPQTDEEIRGMTSTTPIRPTFHHFNLKTTRLQELIDWYSTVVGAEVTFQDATGAWLTNDAANHRIALLAFPGFVEDPDKDTRTGMHHSAFEYGSFEDLNASYLRLREVGIEPDICIDHGMTMSYYYKDPDGNHVELQSDNFGDWSASKAWMRTSSDFHANPIGVFVDPARIAEAVSAGAQFADIHRRAMAGELSPPGAALNLPGEA